MVFNKTKYTSRKKACIFSYLVKWRITISKFEVLDIAWWKMELEIIEVDHSMYPILKGAVGGGGGGGCTNLPWIH